MQESAERISELAAELQERETRLQEKEFLLIAVTNELEELRRAISDRDSLLRLQEALLAERGPQIVSRKPDEMLELQEQLEELKQELKRRDFKLQSVNWQLREWERRETQLIKLQQAYETANAVSQTGSYRVVRKLSSPLRLFRKRLLPNLRNLPAVISQRRRLRRTQRAYRRAGIGLISREPFALVGPLTVPESQLAPIKALFDAEWYLRQNEDVAQAGLNPLEHYLRRGIIEGRAPHALFDPKFYLKTYPEAAISGMNPLQHYLTAGWKKGFRPNPNFDPSFYASTYSDIAEAGVEPLTHFITTGLREGRATCHEDIQTESFEAEFEIPREPVQAAAPSNVDIKAIAFYLPQFHTIPENDEWWGKGFTEWTNVRRGRPHFIDHYQPHVPANLNYYDLSDGRTLEQQVELAKNYGLYGFCFYYYWFAGKILLDLPLRQMWERGEPDFPFCICWANENWTRRWDGREREILIAQRHSGDDDLAFIKNLERYLLHKNYIRVDSKPLLIVYQAALLPDPLATTTRWRDYFRAQGHGDLFLAAMRTFGFDISAEECGFDAVIQFPPHTASPPTINHLVEGLERPFTGQVYDYNHTKWRFLEELRALSTTQRVYPGVMPSWDNTARRGYKSYVWTNSSPESYYDWLAQVIKFIRKKNFGEDKFVFINAWNEWAEGCHLEPDEIFRYAWLNATRLALQPANAPVPV